MKKFGFYLLTIIIATGFLAHTANAQIFGNFGGPLLLPSTICTCPVPATWILVCDLRLGLPTPLLILPGADINLNFNIVTPGVHQLGTYTPSPGFCGLGTGVEPPTCNPNPMAIPPVTYGNLLPIKPDTIGTGGIPFGACIPGGSATAGAAGAAGAGAAGAAGAGATAQPFGAEEDLNTGTVGDGSTEAVSLDRDFGPQVETIEAPHVTRELYYEKGMTPLEGDDIRQVQQYLIDRNMGTESRALASKLAANPDQWGKYGPATKAALAEFQLQNDKAIREANTLTKTFDARGTLGPTTSNYLNQKGTVERTNIPVPVRGGPANPNGLAQINKNYGNVKQPIGGTWDGSTPEREDRQGHAIFITPEYGIRAYFLNTVNQYTGKAHNKFKTIEKYIDHYTHVPGDRPGYISAILTNTPIAKATDDILLVKNGVIDKSVLYPLARAMFNYENGYTPVTDAQFDEAYRMAFGEGEAE